MVDNPEQAVHIIDLALSAVHPNFGTNITVSPTNTTAIDFNPRPPPAYMVDNQNNYYKTASDTD
ncbi:hypothetical protein PoMZ_04772 [Pyricularia oryzae]|uniref:Uncharacterized protein n=1 Tax=Pyricularia oryzae TaxID=318829 RepID=A0A4P7NAL9_PYROR|nr:hypothetical protein PoMZ_04772 [Pyricularia oryzae]